MHSNLYAVGRCSSIWKAARMLFSGTPLWAQRLSVTALSGTFGAGSNLFVKAVLEMLETEGLWHCLTRLPFYITGVVTVALCALQLFYLNLALSRLANKCNSSFSTSSVYVRNEMRLLKKC